MALSVAPKVRQKPRCAGDHDNATALLNMLQQAWWEGEHKLRSK
jgi:hypothetical protein